MNLISPPHGWKEIPEEAFEAYLKTCPDYRRTGYSGAVRYTFRHDSRDFAVVRQDDCLPKALANSQCLMKSRKRYYSKPCNYLVELLEDFDCGCLERTIAIEEAWQNGLKLMRLRCRKCGKTYPVLEPEKAFDPKARCTGSLFDV